MMCNGLRSYLIFFPKIPFRSILEIPSHLKHHHGATSISGGISGELGLHPVSSSDYMIVHANVERLGVCHHWCHQAHPQLSNFNLNDAENMNSTDFNDGHVLKYRHAFERLLYFVH